MTLDLTATVAARNFSASLQVSEGETVAILGPNGAGKSTLLAVIAGLLKPDDGFVRLADRVLFDAAAPLWLPPHQRGVSLLAQEPLLFPHLSVLDNVAFGPKSAGQSTSDARRVARAWLAEVDASELADRRPASLSGGQAQRIAVARALASDPQLLLLDEPFAALDVAVAPALRRMLRRVLAGRTVVIVTHDVLDAFTLADRVVVMHAGKIVEQGPTREVLLQPRTRFTADLAALNLLIGTRTADGMRLSGTTTRAGEYEGDVAAHLFAESSAAPTVFPLGSAAAMAVRPSAVSVSVSDPSHPSRPALNVIRGIVQDLEPRGDVVRVRGSIPGGHLAADVLPSVVVDLDLDLAPGTPVYFAFEPLDTTLYPGATSPEATPTPKPVPAVDE
jgi:molybdate transport system ATP-binding protein